ncbi:MAG: TIR domain-containing protein [Ruegeria sp.]
MNDVFVSYKREDKDFARAVAEALTARGLQVWWDVDLLPGDRFADEIQSVIAQSKLTVVLWSERSVRSTWVRAEARIAMDASQLLPVRLDAAAIPLPFNDLHTLDLSAWDGATGADALAPLTAAVSKRLGLPDPAIVNDPSDLPAPEAQRRLHDHDDEAAIWRSINSHKDPSADELGIYLRRYPDGLFAELARIRLTQVQRSRWWRRPIALASGLAAVLAPVTIVVALILDLPALNSVLGWSQDTPEAEAAVSVVATTPTTLPRELSPSERAAQRVADDGLLNIARPPSLVPIFIEQFFDEEPRLVRKADQPERRAAILSALGLDQVETESVRPAVLAAAFDRLIAEYRARLPGDVLPNLPLVAPPLRVVEGRSQRPDALTCERPRDFLHFHRTYAEALLLFRAVYLGAFGVNEIFSEEVAYTEAPSWADGARFDLPVPSMSYAEEIGLDLFLRTGAVTDLTPRLMKEIESMDPAWRARIARFARDMLAYRTAYNDLIVSFGRSYFDRVYLTQAVDHAPNPYGCWETSQHMLTFEFEFGCGDLEANCIAHTWFYLRDQGTNAVIRPTVYPGLHQAMLMFWHRRGEAGTDPKIKALLEDIAALDTETPLDFREMDRAIRAGFRR